MCGRYYFDNETAEDVKALTGQSLEELDFPGLGKGADIVPSLKAPVVSGENNALAAKAMFWGFPGFGSSSLLINARAETALEKKSFADSVMNRRCVVPAKWFYEWDKDRNKAVFSLKGSRTIYLAGFYNYPDEAGRYVILTTAANESMIRTHDRMPLMIPENNIRDWIFDDSAVKDFLNAPQPMLEKQQDYEQMRFF